MFAGFPSLEFLINNSENNSLSQLQELTLTHPDPSASSYILGKLQLLRLMYHCQNVSYNNLFSDVDTIVWVSHVSFFNRELKGL